MDLITFSDGSTTDVLDPARSTTRLRVDVGAVATANKAGRHVVGSSFELSEAIAQPALHILPSGVFARPGSVAGPRPAPLTTLGPGDWRRGYVVRLAALDAIGVALIAAGLVAIRSDFVGQAGSHWWIAVAVLLWPTLIAGSRGYDRGAIGASTALQRSLVKASIAAAALAAIVAAFLPGPWLTTAVGALPLLLAFGLATRSIAGRRLRRRQAAGLDTRPMVLVGDVHAVVELAERIEKSPHSGIVPVGACLPTGADPMPLLSHGIPVVGDLDKVARAVRDLGAAGVAVCSGVPDGYLRTLAWSLEMSGADLLIDTGLVEVAESRLYVRPLDRMALVQVAEPTFTGWRRVLKSGLDRLAAGLGLLLLGPLLIVVSCAIKLETRGPVFYRQTRVGKNSRTFTMWKFRSMVVDADKSAVLHADNDGNEVMYKLRSDPRVTKVGRFIRSYSIDELPQLFNVLGGSMSLVGPRPPLPSEVDKYEAHARRRLLVRPGLTGLWQVSGRSDLSWDETVRLDLHYVENWSLSSDLQIMMKTVSAVLRRDGAY